MTLNTQSQSQKSEYFNVLYSIPVVLNFFWLTAYYYASQVFTHYALDNHRNLGNFAGDNSHGHVRLYKYDIFHGTPVDNHFFIQ